MKKIKLSLCIVFLACSSFIKIEKNDAVVVKKKLLLVLDYHEILDKNKKRVKTTESGKVTYSYSQKGDHVTYTLTEYLPYKLLSENILSKEHVICNDINRNAYLTFYINRLGKSVDSVRRIEKEIIDLGNLPKNSKHYQVKGIEKTFKLYLLYADCERYILKSKSKEDTVYVLKKVNNIKNFKSNVIDKSTF